MGWSWGDRAVVGGASAGAPTSQNGYNISLLIMQVCFRTEAYIDFSRILCY